jgi:hypothetical protein
MNPHQDDHVRTSERPRVRGGIDRAANRSHRRLPRGRPPSIALLLLALGLLLPATAVAAERQTTPGSTALPLPAGVAVDRLIDATLDSLDLPANVETLALARVTLAPGATAKARVGVHLFIVEAGALTVQEYAHLPPPPSGTPEVSVDVPVGSPVTHDAGDQFLVVSGVVAEPAIGNEGAEPAIALVVSLAATSGGDIEGFLTNWSAVEPIAVEDATNVYLDQLLAAAVASGRGRLSVALDRVHYAEGAGRGPGGELVDEAMIDIGSVIADPGTRLIAVETGAMNYLVVDPALFRRAGEAPQQVPGRSRVSQLPGDQLLVLNSGRMLTRNVARGPSTVLIVTIADTTPVSVDG